VHSTPLRCTSVPSTSAGCIVRNINPDALEEGRYREACWDVMKVNWTSMVKNYGDNATSRIGDSVAQCSLTTQVSVFAGNSTVRSLPQAIAMYIAAITFRLLPTLRVYHTVCACITTNTAMGRVLKDPTILASLRGSSAACRQPGVSMGSRIGERTTVQYRSSLTYHLIHVANHPSSLIVQASRLPSPPIIRAYPSHQPASHRVAYRQQL
jgi:hypothetical protein